jgi:uncharacterized membrane protein
VSQGKPQTPLRFFTLLAFAAYPFIVYFLLDQVGPGGLGLALIALLLLRNLDFIRSHIWAIALALPAAILFITLKPPHSEWLLRFYPTLVNLALLLTFGITLFRRPTMVERFAKLSGVVITHAVRRYTFRITVMWCGFFFFNALASAAIALSASMGIWAFYNGFLSYIIIGALLGGEYLYRRAFIKQEQADENATLAAQSAEAEL